MCDDVSMGALSGSIGERTEAVLAAGCDVALHCNGDMAEMEQVAAASPSWLAMPPAASTRRWPGSRLRRASSMLAHALALLDEALADVSRRPDKPPACGKWGSSTIVGTPTLARRGR